MQFNKLQFKTQQLDTPLSSGDELKLLYNSLYTLTNEN